MNEIKSPIVKEHIILVNYCASFFPILTKLFTSQKQLLKKLDSLLSKKKIDEKKVQKTWESLQTNCATYKSYLEQIHGYFTVTKDYYLLRGEIDKDTPIDTPDFYPDYDILKVNIKKVK